MKSLIIKIIILHDYKVSSYKEFCILKLGWSSRNFFTSLYLLSSIIWRKTVSGFNNSTLGDLDAIYPNRLFIIRYKKFNLNLYLFYENHNFGNRLYFKNFNII